MTPDDYSKLADEIERRIKDDSSLQDLSVFLAGNAAAIVAALRLAAQAQEWKKEMRHNLKGIEFVDADYCPACAGWGIEEGACTPQKHIATCWLNAALQEGEEHG